jgi:hypothetical protein
MEKAYFLKGDQYVRFDVAMDAVDAGYPLPIADGWRGLDELDFAANLDAAVDLGEGDREVHLFKGGEVVVVDEESNAVKGASPLSIAEAWPGLAAAGFDVAIDAAFADDSGTGFFFEGSQYVSVDLATRQLRGGPSRAIADGWAGMETVNFERDIDAALHWSTGKVYFFKGGLFVRYDIASESVDEGYPAKIAAFWQGLEAAGFDSGIDVAWRNPRFLRPGAG